MHTNPKKETASKQRTEQNRTVHARDSIPSSRVVLTLVGDGIIVHLLQLVVFPVDLISSSEAHSTAQQEGKRDVTSLAQEEEEEEEAVHAPTWRKRRSRTPTRAFWDTASIEAQSVPVAILLPMQ